MRETVIYFIRHAQSIAIDVNSKTRLLTEKGMADRLLVTDFLKDKNIEVALSSTYQRSIDTISDFTEKVGLDIELIDDFKEFGKDGKDDLDYFISYPEFVERLQKHWADFSYQHLQSETFYETQYRNMSALVDVLYKHMGKTIIIGTHGTALALIINYYDKTFGFDKYMEMVEITPWCMCFKFQGFDFLSMESTDLKGSRALRIEDY